MLNISQSTQKAPESVLSVMGFPHGLNTSVPVFQIEKTECSALINWVIKRGGKVVTRDPITQYTTTVTTGNSPVKEIASVNIGSTTYTLLQDDNHKVYYLDGDPKPVSVATLAARATIIGYNGVAILMDGDYLKYMDDVSSIKICYDDGTGSSGHQFDNRSGSQDSTLALGNGTNIRVATKFTSQAWTAGYTIPPTTVSAYLSKAGSPTGSIITKLRLVSDDSVLATKTFLSDVSTLTGTATLYTSTFTSGDITNEMSPSIDYYITLEYSAGDGANYVDLHCEDVSSGGSAYYYIAAWAQSATKDPIMALRPGRPPKGAFGAIKDERLLMAGDPDNVGYLWYCNLTHLDWSTSNGGGYIGAVDDHKDNYEIGGINVLYGDLLVYGTESQPYLSKLEGSSPSDYALPLSFQKVWATNRTLISAVNDIWSASATGVDPLSGVQEYGDLRTFSASDPIKDRFDDYWDSDTAFASYYPKEGQYLLVMPSYHRVLILHTKLPVRNPSGQGLRYPAAENEYYRDIFTSSTYKWTASGSGTNEYYLEIAAGGDPSIAVKPDFITLDGEVITEGTMGSLSDHEWDYGDNDGLGYDTVYFADATGDPDSSGVDIRSILIPTAMASVGSNFLIGGSEGYVYKIDSSEYKDLTSHQINPKLGSAYVEIPFGYANFIQFQLAASSTSGGTVGVDLYKDGQRVTDVVETSLGVSDGLTVDQAVMDVDEAYFSVDIEQTQLFKYINFNARAIMFVLKDITITGYPIYISGLLLKFRRLSY